MGSGHRRRPGAGPVHHPRAGARRRWGRHQLPAQRRCCPGPGRRTGPRALALQADVTDAAAVQRLFAQVRERTSQPISAVVNNAWPSSGLMATPARRLATSPGSALPSSSKAPSKRAQHHPGRPARHARANKALAASSTWAPTCSRTRGAYHDYTAAKGRAALVHPHRGQRPGPARHHGEHGVRRPAAHHRRQQRRPEAVFDLIASMTPCAASPPARVCRRRAVLPLPWARAVTGKTSSWTAGWSKG